MSSVTIYDVAEKAEVSIATVSRVLNSPHRVNERTRRRVLATIDSLGFVPKAEATARARRVTNRIGVLAPFFTYPSFVQRLRGISETLAATSCEMVIYNVDSAQRLLGYLESLPILRRLDGLILVSVLVDDSIVDRLLAHNLQTVVIETAHPALSGVEIDNHYGGELAAQYLLQRGYRRPAFVGGDVEIPNYTLRTSVLRLAGFRRTLEAAGVGLPEQHVTVGEHSVEAARLQAHALLDLNPPPDAIFAANDTLALGVLKAARQREMRLPTDLGVIGFDDLDTADHLGLTTISQSLDESGRVAVELLLARLAEPERPAQHVRLPLTVIERETA